MCLCCSRFPQILGSRLAGSLLTYPTLSTLSPVACRCCVFQQRSLRFLLWLDSRYAGRSPRVPILSWALYRLGLFFSVACVFTSIIVVSKHYRIDLPFFVPFRVLIWEYSFHSYRQASSPSRCCRHTPVVSTNFTALFSSTYDTLSRAFPKLNSDLPRSCSFIYGAPIDTAQSAR